MSDKPFIHLFKTPGGFYLYDVNTDMILGLRKDVYEYLDSAEDCTYDDAPDGIKQYIAKMQNDGYLSSNRIKEVEHPATQILKYILDRKLHMITLQVTQNCNLRCSYCAYSGNYKNRTHSNKSMSLELALKGIDYIFEHSIDK